MDKLNPIYNHNDCIMLDFALFKALVIASA